MLGGGGGCVALRSILRDGGVNLFVDGGVGVCDVVSVFGLLDSDLFHLLNSNFEVGMLRNGQIICS